MTGSREQDVHTIPDDLPEENIITIVKKDVINGYVPNIEYVVYVDPEEYYKIDKTQMLTVARHIGHINSALKKQKICPGRPGQMGKQPALLRSQGNIFRDL